MPKLVSVNGETPTTLEGWGTRLRGDAGTTVKVEVEYSCGGDQTVTIEREVIRARRPHARR